MAQPPAPKFNFKVVLLGEGMIDEEDSFANELEKKKRKKNYNYSCTFNYCNYDYL
jgi:hypothetical protein